ncbi:MAG: SDR family oxidoreductase [Porticoccaceae bacterium]|nr:SDR family oxidoreductase [Porticoccaceae bacterium]
MKILVTGNLGYIGPAVLKALRVAYPSSELVGMDLGFFAHCFTGVPVSPDLVLDRQIYKDVRAITDSDLAGFDAVIQLAAVSNDPMGDKFAVVTDEINCQSSLKIARAAKRVGVKSYVFASSCSVYGAASKYPKKENDELNPLTAYAKSKIDTEIGLEQLAGDSFTITCLRFATACGFSARTRLDLVLNDFVAGAVSSGVIDILSDGTPWRPLIHIDDMARAIDWAVTRRASNGGDMLVVNAGSDEWNYQVKDLANAVAQVIPGTDVNLNLNAVPDKRSYQVDFGKFRILAPNHQPEVSLLDAVRGLYKGLNDMNFSDKDFRTSQLIRLNTLNAHIVSGRLSSGLTWQEKFL